MPGQPAGHLEAGFGRGGEGVLRGEGVVDAGDQDPGLDAEVPGGRVGEGQVADHPATAVEPHEQGEGAGGRRGGPVQPDRHGPLRRGHREVLDGAHLGADGQAAMAAMVLRATSTDCSSSGAMAAAAI